MNKPYDLALVTGRLQHIHSGHEHLINTAMSLADRVILCLGSAQEYGTIRNPFAVTTRAKLIQEIYPEIIIAPLNDLSAPLNHVCAEWGHHVLSTVKQHVRKVPDVFVYGNEHNNQHWFDLDQTLKDMAQNMTEVIVSREKHVISATYMRELLFRDDFAEWHRHCNPKVHKHYDDLRKELLNAKGLEENVRVHLHPHEGWTDKPVYMSKEMDYSQEMGHA